MALTDRVEELCDQYLRKIGQIGGMVEAVEHGFLQGEIAGAAFTYRQEPETGSTEAEMVAALHLYGTYAESPVV